MNIIIKNGIVVNATNIYKADIGIRDEKIVAINNNLNSSNALVIDASNKYVFPGGIDVHTHLDLSIITNDDIIKTQDNFTSGTIAAACGGTTSIIDHCFQDQGETLGKALDKWHNKALGKAVIDYSFHIDISDFNDSILCEISNLTKKGYLSYKVYTAYNFMLNDEKILKLLTCTRDNGGLICVHAENYHIIKYLTNLLITDNKKSPKYHPVSRPSIAEIEATYRVIKLAELVNAPLYIVHVTCKKSLNEIITARKDKLKIMGETCPQYLLLSDEKYSLPDFQSAKYVLSPPLRSENNQKYLWEGLKSGDLVTIASDHCAFNFIEQKNVGSQESFASIPNGIPGIELRMPLLFSFGVIDRKISLQKFVEITATNPAKIFGLYPNKGTIAVDSDADIVIFDPERKVKITHDLVHENVDYTPYEGLEITGYPIFTISRGCVIMKNGIFTGNKGWGKFLPMKKIQCI